VASFGALPIEVASGVDRDGKALASRSDAGTIRLWEVAKASAPPVPRGPIRGFGQMIYLQEIDSVAFTADGNTLASGSNDRRARPWDVAAAKDRPPRRGHVGAVQAVAFSPAGKTLASGGGYPRPGEVRLWDVPAFPRPAAEPHRR